VSADAKLLGLKPKTDPNFFVSDEVLKRDGFVKLLTHIKQNDVKEISIVGGSHSGLSCAWMLINGSAMYDYKDYQPQEFDMDFFDPELREQMFTKQKRKASSENQQFSERETVETYRSTSEFSELDNEDGYIPWYVGGILSHPDFCHIKIKIICNKDLLVHYESEEEAGIDGYTNYNKEDINYRGAINRFIGIKGDAKQLWRRVTILKTEDKVEFIKADDPASQTSAIRNSDIVIWACGYESIPIPINITDPLTNNQELLDLKMKNGKCQIDDDLRLVVNKSSRKYNLFGIGLGYSINTSNKHIKGQKNPNTRADGISLYISTIPSVLFTNIRPKKAKMKHSKDSLFSRSSSIQREKKGTYSGNAKRRGKSIEMTIIHYATLIKKSSSRVLRARDK